MHWHLKPMPSPNNVNVNTNVHRYHKCYTPVKVLNARHLKPPEVHRGTLADKYARVGKLKAKSNLNMTRSQRNLQVSSDWRTAGT